MGYTVYSHTSVHMAVVAEKVAAEEDNKTEAVGRVSHPFTGYGHEVTQCSGAMHVLPPLVSQSPRHRAHHTPKTVNRRHAPLNRSSLCLMPVRDKTHLFLVLKWTARFRGALNPFSEFRTRRH